MAFVFGSTGNDTLAGGTSGDDTYYAGVGHDVAVATNGNDVIVAGYAKSSDYWRAGFPDNDFDRVLYDSLWSQNGYANAADVRIVVDLQAGTVQKFGAGNVSLGTDTLIGVDAIRGTAGNDSFVGRQTWDYEEFRGEAGNDAIDGRGGTDAASYVSATAAITVNLAAGTVTGDASVGSDTLREIEFVLGTGFADTYDATGYGATSVNRHSWGDSWNFFLPGGGDDVITGNGDTTLQYNSVGGALSVDLGLLTNPTVQANVIVNATTGSFTGAGGAPGNDLVSGVSGFRGSNYNDTLVGGGRVNSFVTGNTVSGDKSVEHFRGNAGNDFIDGKTGYDRADYHNTGTAIGVDIDLAAGVVVGDPLVTGTDTLRGVEAVGGSYLDDRYDATGFTLSNAVAPSLNSGDVMVGVPAGETLASLAFNEFRVHAGHDTVIGNGATRITFNGVLQETLSGSQPSLSLVFTGAGAGSASYGQNDGGFGTVTFSGTFSVRGSNGNDSIVGNAGYQNLQAAYGNDTVLGGDGADVLFGWYGVEGTRVNPTTLFTDNDSLAGGAGNDLIRGDFGNDTLDGGLGIDTMEGGTGSDSYHVDVAGDVTTEAASGSVGGTDTVFSSVNRTLGANLERLTLTGANPINGTGNTLANIITGNAAANILNGGAGKDQLTGGLGADDYRFSTALNASTNVDSIVGFNAADDRISLDDAVFTAVGPLGALAATAFNAGTGAGDAGDRIVYNAATGQIFYDADGTGALAQVLFATVAPGTAITAADFFVV